jgi:hypothetical protein
MPRDGITLSPERFKETLRPEISATDGDEDFVRWRRMRRLRERERESFALSSFFFCSPSLPLFHSVSQPTAPTKKKKTEMVQGKDEGEG